MGNAMIVNRRVARTNASCISATLCWRREKPASETRFTVKEIVVTGQLETLNARK